MSTWQRQFILMSHAAAITFALPLFSYSIQWLNSANAKPSSVIHPSHQVEAHQIITTWASEVIPQS